MLCYKPSNNKPTNITAKLQGNLLGYPEHIERLRAEQPSSYLLVSAMMSAYNQYRVHTAQFSQNATALPLPPI